MSVPPTVPAAFAARVADAPDAVAVASASEQLTYRQLDVRSDTIAAALAEAGTRPGDRVAVSVERSVALVAALLGVLKTGAAFVPLDPGEPPARRAAMLADADVRLAVADSSGEAVLRQHGITVIGAGGRTDLQVTERAAPDLQVTERAAPDPGITGQDMAYLMYTSGSTGRPKGVMIAHRGIVNLVTAPTYVDLRRTDRLLHLAPVAFDASTFEIWGALLNGARLEIAPPGPTSPAQLATLIRERGITVLWLTAALFHRQIDADPGSLRGLRTVLAGGDVLSVAHVRKLAAELPELEIVNGYGPTEATTFALCHRVTAGEQFDHVVPIGVPIQGVRAEIRDGAGAPVPDGVEGELWLGGAGVALGYWRQPELSAQRFRPDPAGGSCYRTGDRARRRADRVIEFLGRVDGQFKLRGHRVEPGEIENALVGYPGIDQAVVAVRDNHLGDPRLVAWVATADTTLDRGAVRAFLRQRLPDYMIPAVFLTVTELPVTVNGKIDRSALPDPPWTRKDIYV